MMIIKKYGWFLLLLLVIALPVFAHLTDLPIQIWDEARLAHNAYEMLQSGNWLVTKFNSSPDMWNTKPPLMIWLMAGSMKLVGFNELAVRLPSAIAAVFTFIYLFWFVRKTTGDKRMAFLTGFILVTADGYMRLHGTRTGDYDALLTLFTTIYIGSYYLFLRLGSGKYLWLFFLSLSAAVLTKGIAGMLFLPALGLYALFSKKAIATLRSGSFYGGLITFLILVLGFYWLREHYNEGYIKAVLENEVGGRFGTVIEHHAGGPLYYLQVLVYPHFAFWLMFLPIGIVAAFLSQKENEQSLFSYLLVVAFVFYIIISYAESKLNWYHMPVFPVLAIIAARGVSYVIAYIEAYKVRNTYKVISVAVVFLIIFVIPYTYAMDTALYPKAEPGANSAMGLFLKESAEGKWGLDGYIFTDDTREDQNITFYVKASKYRVYMKDMKELEVGDTVAVFKEGAKNAIRERYITDMIRSFGEVNVFLLKDTVSKTNN